MMIALIVHYKYTTKIQVVFIVLWSGLEYKDLFSNVFFLCLQSLLIQTIRLSSSLAMSLTTLEQARLLLINHSVLSLRLHLKSDLALGLTVEVSFQKA